MSGYSQVIPAREWVSRSEVRVSALAAWLVPSVGAAIFAVTLLHVLFLSEGTRVLFRDSDAGWHIRNGEAILTNASVPRVDSFSYTHAGRPWFAWEWLSDAVLGAAHQLAGPSGVALLAALVIALTAWGSARLALSLGGNLFLTAVATVLLLGATSIHWLARPHIFSWLIALVFLAITEHDRRRPSRALYWLPALACLWANLHGSFLLGPGILFLYAVGEWLQGLRNPEFGIRDSKNPNPESRISSRQGRRFAVVCLASLAATFINPYGWSLHQHVFAYLQNTYLMDHISEFRSFSFHAPGAIYVELFLLAAVLGALALIRQRAYGPALLAFALLHMSLYSARHLPTAAVLLLPLCVAALTREAENWPGWRPLLAYSERLRAIDQRVCGVALVALALVASVVGVRGLARDGRVGFHPAQFPAGAADYIEQRGLDQRVFARIFAKDQWGGYLIYRFEGRLKVFVDGRSDFYGTDLLETYAKVVEVKPGWNAVLKQYGVQFVLTPTDHALASALELSLDWKRVYTDSVATVFERTS